MDIRRGINGMVKNEEVLNKVTSNKKSDKVL